MKHRLSRPALAVCLLAVLSACTNQVGKGTDESQNKNGAPVPADAEKPALDDLGSVGSAARSILRKDPFTEIVLEIAFVAGREPSPGAISHLTNVLAAVTGKSITAQEREISGRGGAYSAADIRELSKNRSTRSRAPTVAIWIAYLDGKLTDNSDALGAAVAATVAVIFPDQIDTISALVQPGAVERAALAHEVGHLLALVNIGYQSKSDHEDPEHPNHSSNRSSVMYWAVESLSVANIFAGGPPDDFDEADREDLQMLASA